MFLRISLYFSIWEQDTHLLLTGGIEKILRIYDLNRPDAPPREVDKSPGSVRTVAWLHSDQTILSSCTDMGGVRYKHALLKPLLIDYYLLKLMFFAYILLKFLVNFATDYGM